MTTVIANYYKLNSETHIFEDQGTYNLKFDEKLNQSFLNFYDEKKYFYF